MEQINPLYNLIISILGEPGPGKINHTKQQYGFNCPECSNEKGVQNDGKYNLEVNLKQLVFKCWACSDINNTHGSLKKLIRERGTKFQLKQYLSLVDEDDEQNNNDDNQHYKGPIYLPRELILFKDGNKNDLSYKESINYLALRGLNDEIIEKYNMGYCSEGRYENRIIIPSYDENNKLNYFVARSFTGQKIKYLNPNIEKMNLIINEHNINWNNSLFICEGMFDMIGLYPLTNIIPLIGKVMSDHLYYTLIKKLNGGYIFIVLDGDAKIEMYQIYKRLHTTIQLKDKIRVVDIPTDTDLSQIRKDFGLSGIRELLKSNKKLKLDDYMANEI